MAKKRKKTKTATKVKIVRIPDKKRRTRQKKTLLQKIFG